MGCSRDRRGGNVDSIEGADRKTQRQSESPSMETRSEANRAIVDIYPDHTHGTVIVSICGDNDVDILDNPRECLEQLFLSQLQLEKSSVHFVHEQNRPNPLSDGLS